MDRSFNVVPKHVGFIMDGNGRWAKSRNQPRNYGHKKGADAIEEVVETCFRCKVEAVTLYAFSTENWSRPKDEVDAIMALLEKFIAKYSKSLIKEQIRLIILGDLTRLDEKMQNTIKNCMQKTENFQGKILNIAINYGSRQEIARAFNLMTKEGKTEITADDISNYLYTSGQPDVDLIVRTSGEQRISNFLLFQSAYAELYFTPTLWPDMNKQEVYNALEWFENRNRRFGNV